MSPPLPFNLLDALAPSSVGQIRPDNSLLLTAALRAAYLVPARTSKGKRR